MLTFAFAYLLLGAVSVFADSGTSQEKAVDSSTLKASLIQVINCPSGTTTCGPGNCCLYRDATCCEDGEHCCPNGYSCDLPNQQCVKKPVDELPVFSVINMRAAGFMIASPFDKYRYIQDTNVYSRTSFTNRYKSCPGEYKQCPQSTSCCLNDDGAWSCCPKPAYPIRKEGDDQCCMTIFLGYICCVIPIFPYCTPFGCVWLNDAVLKTTYRHQVLKGNLQLWRKVKYLQMVCNTALVTNRKPECITYILIQCFTVPATYVLLFS